jgi:hypothetical protein
VKVRRSWRIFAAVSLVMGGQPARAQEPVSPFDVEIDRLVVLAGGGPIGQERTVERDEVVMRTRIGYSAAAIPARPLSITLADVPITIAAQYPLFEASVRGNTRATLGRDTRVFCGQRQDTKGIRIPKGLRGPGRRFQNEIQPCLVDRDDDRSFDAIILVGARWPSDRLVVPVEPLSYELMRDIPIPDSDLTVTFKRHSPAWGWVLQLGGRLLGTPYELRSIRLRPPEGAWQGFDGFPGVGKGIFPNVIEFGAARISVLAYDSDAHRVRLRIDRPFETADVELKYMTRGPTIITIYH